MTDADHRAADTGVAETAGAKPSATVVTARRRRLRGTLRPSGRERGRRKADDVRARAKILERIEAEVRTAAERNRARDRPSGASAATVRP